MTDAQTANTMVPNATPCAMMKTIAPIEAGAIGPIIPEFLEVADVQKVYGIRKTMLYALMRSGDITSVLLRRPGGKSGKRLVYAKSCRDWLMRQMEEQSWGKNS